LTIELLNQIFELCIVPLLGVLTTFLVQLIRKKTQELTETESNAKTRKYIQMLSETITNCVIATNQTYVDNLKDKNAFDEAAQKEAFNKTYQSVIETLNNEAYKYLQLAYGDLEEYIKTKIEAEVNTQKKEA
jgi:alpha-galactosidase